MKKLFFLSLLAIAIYTNCTAQTLTAADAASKVSFVIKNIGINVNGTLNGLKGKMYFDPKNLAASAFDMTVDVNTINTGIEKRDKHLKSEDYFDAAKYPVINIKTTKLLAKGGNKYFAQAILTMHGVSKNIQFDFMANPQADGYTFSGGFPLNRRDYGVGGSSMIMADNLNVSLYVVAKK